MSNNTFFGANEGDWSKDLPQPPTPVPGTYNLFLPRTLTLLAAKPGSGKSTMLAHIAVNVAAHGGIVAWGYGEARDESINNIKRESVINGINIDKKIVLIPDDHNALQQVLDMPLRYGLEDCSLLIIDSFSSCFSINDESGNAEISKVLKKLTQTKKIDPAPCIILVHHTKKSHRKNDYSIDNVSGADSFNRFADEVYIGNKSDNGFTIQRSKSRIYGRNDESRLSFAMINSVLKPSSYRQPQPEPILTDTQTVLKTNGAHP